MERIESSQLETNMAELSNDLILKIISNLPLNFLVQCKRLNKDFKLMISDHVFQYQNALRSSTSNDCLLHHSTSNPCTSIMKTRLQFPYNNVGEVSDLSRLPNCLDLPIILSSSGGLLLLKFYNSSFYVFNPVTGGYRFIPSPGGSFIGLASQLANPSSYKLVAISSPLSENEKCYLFKIFDSDANKWRISRTTCSFSNNGIPFSSIINDYYQAVHFDDSLHWLKEDGDILVFNVKTEVAKIINPPEVVKKEMPFFRTWFGVSQDKLTMAISCHDSKTISIYFYDSLRDEWNIDKILEDAIPNHYNDGKGYPVFYDGKRLILLLAVPGVENNGLYMYDVEANSLTKIKTMPWWTDSRQTFRHYFGTLANIPHCSYLHEKFKQQGKNGRANSDILRTLFCMRKYLYLEATESPSKRKLSPTQTEGNLQQNDAFPMGLKENGSSSSMGAQTSEEITDALYFMRFVPRSKQNKFRETRQRFRRDG